MKNNKAELLRLIDEKLAEIKSGKQPKPKRKPPTRAESNRANGDNSTGPRTPEGKARASENSLKHGFFAHIEKLHPHDSRTYIQLVNDLRQGLAPDGPAEEHLIRELAMLSARLHRLECAEHALILGNVEGNAPAPTPPSPDGFIDYDHFGDSLLHPDGHVTETPDSRAIALALERSLDTLERLQKIETHLRRAYRHTWDRLERMQRERHNMPLDVSLKRTQIHATYEAIRNNQPEKVPARDHRIDEKGKLITYPKNHPMWRPKKGDDEEEDDPKAR